MALRSGIGITEETDKEKNKKKTITRNVRGVESKTTYDDEVSGLTAAAAGVGGTGRSLVSSSSSSRRRRRRNRRNRRRRRRKRTWRPARRPVREG